MAPNLDEVVSAAARAHAAGRLDEAEKLCRTVLGSRPQDAQALLLLGVIASKKQNPREAIPLLRQVRQLDPTSFHAPFWLASALLMDGRAAEAVEPAETAVRRNPNDAQAQNLLGLCQLELLQWAGAETSFRHAAKLAPNIATIHDNLGRALQGLGRNAEAAEAFGRSAELAPRSVAVWNRLGEALMLELDHERAANCARRMLDLDLDSVAGHLLLARSLMEDGGEDEAEEHVLRAVQLAPDQYLAVAQYGRLLQTRGRIAEARTQFLRSIELEPAQGFAYFALSHCQRVTEAERPIVQKMEDLLLEGALPTRHLGHLEFGLGKALGDLGDFEGSMRHYDEANRIAYGQKFGSKASTKKLPDDGFDFAIKTFNKGFLDRYRSKGLDDDIPIFVVGMMRSGTTLTEQILSSHPQIGAAGEQRFWSMNGGSAIDPTGPSLDMRRLRTPAEDYCSMLREIAPGKPFVVDKMPVNYAILGLIHIALPNAKIIHTQRHPVDTCLSIWATPNRSRLVWSNNKANIVFAYRQYLKIMEHWRRILPPDRFMEVRYEDLVSDRERLTREMISFCGLEWDEACLSPEKNERAVLTPSVWQVRQPVYKTSMERWRKYEPWLGEFAELLDPV